MKILRSWLADYVDIDDVSDARLEELLTTRVAEVENVNSDLFCLDKIIIAKISQVSSHPNSEKLSLVRLDLNGQEIEVVCGDKSCKVGEIVPYASVGAYIFKSKNQEEPEKILIEERPVAGVISKGLLLSEAELGLGPDNDNVLRLTESYLGKKIVLGTELKQFFNTKDLVIEIDNKSLTHRPDLWGHLGFARELSALLNRKLKLEIAEFEFGSKDSKIKVEVEANSGCRRFTALSFEGINNNKSPLWLRQRLFRVGSGVKNLLVDLSNYVMRDVGQPNHAYDLDLLLEDTIRVRSAKDAEVFLGLDDKEYKLTANDIAIADSKRVLALGGIIGGKETSITESTKSILFESANFDPIIIRKSAKRHGLRTDASNRFEKSQSAYSAALATSRFAKLISELSPGAKALDSGFDAFTEKAKPVSVAVNFPYIRSRLGKEMTDVEIEKVLTSLGLKKEKETWQIPHYRATRDLSNQDDLVEEVGRIIGYENIPEQIPLIQPIAVKSKNSYAEQISQMLRGMGFAEIYNYSFVSPEHSKKLGYPCSEELKLKNPIDSDLSCVRSSLVPSMISAVNNNLKRFDAFALYEFGRAYSAIEKKNNRDSGAEEKQFLCFALTTQNNEKQEISNFLPPLAKGVGFYSAVSVVRSILGNLELSLEPFTSPLAWMHPYRNAKLIVAGIEIGNLAEVTPELTSQRVQIAEIDFVKLSLILENNNKNITYKAYSRFPNTFFEISVVMPEKEPFNLLEKILKSSVDHSILKEMQVLSVYRGKPLEDGQKSVSVKLYLGSDHGTLSSEEVTKIQSSVMNAIGESSYSLRT